jgi:hypothetical protein
MIKYRLKKLATNVENAVIKKCPENFREKIKNK